MNDNLKKRVEQFHCLQLPGQPMAMHMGTSYLVNDLVAEIERLEEPLLKARGEIGDQPLTDKWRYDGNDDIWYLQDATAVLRRTDTGWGIWLGDDFSGEYSASLEKAKYIAERMGPPPIAIERNGTG